MKLTLSIAIAGLWLLAFCDWLEPGWLKFGIPASPTQPFTTVITYDVQCMARRSLHQAVMTTVESHTPDVLEFWNWTLFSGKQAENAKEHPCHTTTEGEP